MLPKTAEYALRAVVWLANAPDRREAAEPWAKRTKIPRRYLHKVLQSLVQGGIVDSQSGPGGGYALCVTPKRLTILDVVNAVAPLERIRHCPLGLPTHTHTVVPASQGARSGLCRNREGVWLSHRGRTAPLNKQNRSAL